MLEAVRVRETARRDKAKDGRRARGVASTSAGVEGLTAETHTDTELETRFERAVLGGTALGGCSEEGWAPLVR